MRTPFIWRVRKTIIRFIVRFTGHEYGCCSRIFRRCSKCEYVKGELK